MRYLLPRMVVTGKQPVWYVEILPIALKDFNNAILFWMRGSVMGTYSIIISVLLLSMEGVAVILVD